MRFLVRFLLRAIALVAMARAGLFLAYAWAEVGNPLEVFHLEAKMVHLAWRVQHGLALYPDWREFPHVMNPFGPVYFLIVGRLGRIFSAGYAELFTLGRWVTIGAGISTAILVGLVARRRYGAGPLASLAAASLTLGTAPMGGFGVMVRCDVLAGLLGFAGFLLAVGRPTSPRLVLGGALLVASIFTKQTEGAYLLAASIALALTGQRRPAISLLVGGLLASAGIVALGSLFEPHFLDGLLGASATPASPSKWAGTLGRLATLGGELLLLPILGLVLWSRGKDKDRDLPMATLVVVLLISSVATSIKVGSDLNYFLGLRLVAGLSVAALWSAAERRLGDAESRPWALVAALTLALASLWPGAELMWVQRSIAVGKAYVIRTPTGMARLGDLRSVLRIAADPDRSLLTDSGLVALYQGARAPFVDPWLFRTLVVNAAIDPVAVRSKIEGEEYDLIVTQHDLESETYLDYEFGLPPELAEAARRHYRSAGVLPAIPDLFLYEPRSTGAPSAPY